MKIPLTPPDYNQLLRTIIGKSSEQFMKILAAEIRPDPKGNYYHWDKLRHLKSAPDELTNEQWWLGIKTARKSQYISLPHTDKFGTPFVYSEPDVVRRLLHEIDVHGGGEIKTAEQIENPETRDTYLISSLTEEAITSSQLEGAATTRKVAKEMLRQNRKPRDKSEKMIINNYHAMQYINEIADEELSPELVFELHRTLTEGTLDNDESVGQLRTSDDIYVGDDRDATIIHVPPKASELKKRMAVLCDFANDTTTIRFMHPVIRAILLHFMLAYDHPFEDGNGRTARALFYWSMRRQGYWTMEYISISKILKEAPVKYTRAYLYTETDDNDTTYFILHQLEVIFRAINELFKYLEKKSQESRVIENLFRKSPELKSLFNARQISLLTRALRKPGSIFFVQTHRRSHNITYDTARTDLLKLVDMGLLNKSQTGKAFTFKAVDDLKSHLKDLRV